MPAVRQSRVERVAHADENIGRCGLNLLTTLPLSIDERITTDVVENMRRGDKLWRKHHVVLCYLLIDLPNLDIIAIFGGRINWLVRVRAHSRSVVFKTTRRHQG